MKRSYILGAILLIGFSFSLPGIVHGAYDSTKGLIPCGGYNLDGTDQHPCAFEDVMVLINNVIDFLIFTMALPIAAIVFAWAGFLYLTSGDDPGKRTKAKSMMVNVVIGIVLALAAWLIVKTILVSLGVKINFLGLEI